MSNLILVRHGQSVWNLEKRFTGWVDVDLTRNGELEATKAGHLIKASNINIDVYYSSLKNIQKFTTPGIEKYITDKNLYEHCKSRYVDKLISKKTKKSRHRSSKTKKRKNKK